MSLQHQTLVQRDATRLGERQQPGPVDDGDRTAPRPRRDGAVIGHAERAGYGGRPPKVGDDLCEHGGNRIAICPRLARANRDSRLGQTNQRLRANKPLSYCPMPKKKYLHDNAAGSAWLKAVGRRLLWVREEVADSQTQAARLIGVDQSTFSGYENGDRLIPAHVAMRMCDAWGITLDYLYAGKLGSEVRQDVAVRLAAAHPELVEGVHQVVGRRAKEAAPVA